MKINYLKNTQSFGDYQASQVVWIHTSKDHLVLKFAILNKAGSLVYRITDQPDGEEYKVSENSLTEAEIKTINHLVTQNYRDFEWDIDDEEDLADLLGFFGENLARRHCIEQESKKKPEVVVDYIFDSSEAINYEELSQIVYFKKGVTEDEIIEDYLLPELMEREGLDIIHMHIAEDGVVNSYLVTVQDYEID
ncbi:hypothetical protein [Enterococcus sp. DIV0756]|uniref:hypothetical protein n=1 Tax=Enterococcus sp. DIV0756 TaxID=2774636 RepID=UPI003F21F89D